VWSQSAVLRPWRGTFRPIDTAPLRVVQRLARHDEIAVAEPLLRESKRLGMIDLIEIANTKSQAHLAAIGGGTSTEFRSVIATEIKNWKEAARANNIKPE
jgi:hypothetical protein